MAMAAAILTIIAISGFYLIKRMINKWIDEDFEAMSKLKEEWNSFNLAQIKACKKAAMECDLNTKRAREIATLCAKMAKGD